jgi:hypothetical protein
MVDMILEIKDIDLPWGSPDLSLQPEIEEGKLTCLVVVAMLVNTCRTVMGLIRPGKVPSHREPGCQPFASPYQSRHTWSWYPKVKLFTDMSLENLKWALEQARHSKVQR